MAKTRTARLYPTDSERERAYLVGVETRVANGRRSWASMEELALLARTAGAEVAGMTVQRLERPNPAHYIGKGKLEELVAERERVGYSMVIFDDELSPSQQRTLEQALKVKVLDRTALILDIFAMRARTREGRLQVDLAQSQYLLPRLAGQWSHLERLGGRSGAPGAIGVRGPGETQLETDRRLVRNKIARLKAELERVRRHRALYRRRRARTGVPAVALVGYTNAGKSTLMRALTSAEVLIEDQLFATLDPVTRRMTLPSGAHALLTDTVGFIQNLPTQLVAAFRATLEELADADVLLHVIDITHPDAAEQSQTVDDTLADLGLAEKPRVLALNKIDRLVDREGRPVEGPGALGDLEAELRQRFPNAVLISAERGWGLDALAARIEETLASHTSALPATPAGERWAAS
jgi:GTP-binding protein HflX